jgi:hypothetical protein
LIALMETWVCASDGRTDCHRMAVSQSVHESVSQGHAGTRER